MQKVYQPTFLDCSTAAELASSGATKPPGKSSVKKASYLRHVIVRAI